jgi:Holliday junction resolvase RusA-like endonuclease
MQRRPRRLPICRPIRLDVPEGDAFRVTFTVPGSPRGKGAGRAGKIAGHAMIFTDSKTRHEMAALRTFAWQAMAGRPPYAGPVVVRMCAYREVPQSWSAKKRAAALAGDVVPTSRPDCTNYAKMDDALNGLVWVDDRQIVSYVIHKRFGEIPRLVVDVRSAEQQSG